VHPRNHVVDNPSRELAIFELFGPLKSIGSFCCGVRSKTDHSVLNNDKTCDATFSKHSLTICDVIIISALYKQSADCIFLLKCMPDRCRRLIVGVVGRVVMTGSDARVSDHADDGKTEINSQQIEEDVAPGGDERQQDST